MRLRGGVLGAFAALLVITFALAHHFGAGAAQGTTRCGALQLPVNQHPNAVLVLQPGSGGQSLVFEAHVSSIEANMTQTDQPADLIWDQGVANLEQVLTFGTYANGDNFISINGQVPLDAASGQHPVRVCWLYPPNQTWYEIDGLFNVLPSTPTPTSTATPTPTPTATPTATPPGQTPTPSPPEATPIFIPMMLGDADCSGSVTTGDALLPLRFAIGLEGFGDCISAADVNDDHKIDAVDGLDILRDVAGLYTGLAIGTRPTPTPPQYSVVVVAEGGGYDGFARANGVNTWGEVAGETGNHAFFWDPSGSPQLRDLGTLGGLHSAAYGINDNHEVVGSTDAYSSVPGAPIGFTQAFHWDSTAGMTDMGGPPLPGYKSVARDINSKGTAVGYVEHSSCKTCGPISYAFIWDQAGGMHTLFDSTKALAINDWGVAVGGRQGWHDDGTEFTISGPPGWGADAQGISFTNQVVGVAYVPRTADDRAILEAFRWNKSKGTIDLGSLTSDLRIQGYL